MNLKESLLVPALLALPAPPPPNDLEHEEQYLARLRESLSWIMGSVEASAREVGEKYVRREECERLLEEKEQAIAALQAENYQLRVGSEQCQRYLKRYEMKHELLSNKIYHLTKAIAEKDAIIKYLEGKTAPPPASTPTPTARPLNDSLHDCPRTYSKPNLSFAKLRSTSNLMTFEDYANCSLQLPNDPTKRARGDRVRTESSSDVKENESMDNIQPVAATSKLAGFFGTNMFGSLENQKTLTKAHSTTAQQNASFWQYSKPKQDGREQRRHSNFGNAAVPPNHFYRE